MKYCNHFYFKATVNNYKKNSVPRNPPWTAPLPQPLVNGPHFLFTLIFYSNAEIKIIFLRMLCALSRVMLLCSGVTVTPTSWLATLSMNYL